MNRRPFDTNSQFEFAPTPRTRFYVAWSRHRHRLRSCRLSLARLGLDLRDVPYCSTCAVMRRSYPKAASNCPAWKRSHDTQSG
jgi:hypothetical protein